MARPRAHGQATFSDKVAPLWSHLRSLKWHFHPAALTRVSERVVLVISMVLALAVALAVTTLHDHAHGFRDAKDALSRVELLAERISSSEWKIVAAGELTGERSAELDSLIAGVAWTVLDLRRSGLEREATDLVSESVLGYAAEVGQMQRLYAAGRLQDAEEWDDQRVDPAYQDMIAVLAMAAQRLDRDAGRAELLATLGSTLTLVIAGGLMSLLFWRFRVARREALQAFCDPLTGLPNRALFLDRLGHALTRAGRSTQPVAVLFLDLDNFKVINDSLGHRFGDELLQGVAGRLELSLRDSDTAARLGGDEFTVLAEEARDVNDAIKLAQRISERLRAPFALHDHEVFVTTSIGISLSSPDHDDPESLLRDADLALYRAKFNGKARYEVFDESLNAEAIERLALETDLRRAIERREFSVHYQPLVDLTSREVVEVEALVRWQHPQRGLVPPKAFISLAEETGLILPIGQWVLEEACRRVKLWNEQRPADSQVTVSVNVSARQFQSPDMVEVVARTLRETGLDGRNLKLELTESVLMETGEATIAKLTALKQLGVKLAIDDFGTGYSSLAYLRRFPLDVLKIDRSFTSGLGKTSEDTTIVQAIVSMAKSLNLAVAGEGIETAEQLGYLRALKCDLGQGYYFSRPVPAEEIPAVLSRGAAPVPSQDQITPWSAAASI